GEGGGRRGGGGGWGDVVEEVSLDPAHQIDGGVEDRAPRRKTVSGVGANFRIERDLSALEQIMRGRVGREIEGRERGLANLFPRRGCFRRHLPLAPHPSPHPTAPHIVLLIR